MEEIPLPTSSSDTSISVTSQFATRASNSAIWEPMSPAPTTAALLTPSAFRSPMTSPPSQASASQALLPVEQFPRDDPFSSGNRHPEAEAEPPQNGQQTI